MPELLLLVLLANPASPEEFLLSLADSSSGTAGARYWVSSASILKEAAAFSTDSMETFLRTVSAIEVDPGPPHLLETDEEQGTYVVDFPEARWSWIDERGRVIRALGGTSVQMSGGSYYWVELPLFEGGVYVSMRHRLLAGFLGTAVLLGMAVLVLWWVRRKCMEG